MQCTVITISEQKEGPWKTLTEYYLKLLKPHAQVQLIEVKPEAFKNPSQREQVLKKESEKILKQIPADAHVVVLEATGKTISSEAFSTQLQTWTDGTHAVFIIGGPLGISDELKNQANTLLSLSPMTFPHDTARTILLEQLYRAITIQKGKTYHY